MHLVPGAEELMGSALENDPHLNAVRRNTPYDSEEEYMDTYFRLLRADCFAAIQKVGALRKLPKIRYLTYIPTFQTVTVPLLKLPKNSLHFRALL